MNFLKKLVSFPLLLLVRLYQWIISPLFPPSCRFTPTCSSYMIQAIQVWGPFKGVWLGVKRLAKCHPRGGCGYDPVPEKNKSKSN